MDIKRSWPVRTRSFTGNNLKVLCGRDARKRIFWHVFSTNSLHIHAVSSESLSHAWRNFVSLGVWTAPSEDSDSDQNTLMLGEHVCRYFFYRNGSCNDHDFIQWYSWRFASVLKDICGKYFLHCRLLKTLHIQSTLVISNSKGLTEPLRDIRTSTYQSWESEENNKLNNHINKWICNLTPEVRNIYIK